MKRFEKLIYNYKGFSDEIPPEKILSRGMASKIIQKVGKDKEQYIVVKNNKNAECHEHAKIAIKKLATLHIAHGIFVEWLSSVLIGGMLLSQVRE